MIWFEGQPRSLAEIRFVAELVPCPACGTGEVVSTEIEPWTDRRILRARCKRCRTVREMAFAIEPAISERLPPFHLGPEGAPSTLLRPYQLVEELDRIALRVAWEPVSPAVWRDNGPIAERATTCLVELVKFVPEGADAIPDAALDAAGHADRQVRPERYELAWLVEERDRYLELMERRALASLPEIVVPGPLPPPPPPAAPVERRPVPPRGQIDRAALEAHQHWLRSGRQGEGRLDLERIDLTGARLGAWDLTAARLHEVVMERADLAFASFAHADLVELRAAGANVEDGSFVGARLVRTNLSGARLSRCKLDDAVIGGGNWDRAVLASGSLRNARIIGVSLRGADLSRVELDGATFVECDLRDANLGGGTSVQVQFDRCDLRGTRWADRDLTSAEFVDCELAGAAGPARGLDRLAGTGSAGEVAARLALPPAAE
jgi:uncharacterized protein YjbI with pentapeptide repeats